MACLGAGIVEDRQGWSEDPLVSSRIEQGGAEACFGELIAMGSSDSCDEAMKAQPAQIVTDASGCNIALFDSQVLRKQGPQLSITEALDVEGKEQ